MKGSLLNSQNKVRARIKARTSCVLITLFIFGCLKTRLVYFIISASQNLCMPPPPVLIARSSTLVLCFVCRST